MIDNKLQVAAQLMGCEIEDVDIEKYDMFGLKVFSNGCEEWIVGTDEEANEACTDYIKQSLWAFNAAFILSHSKVKFSEKLEKCLKQMQEKLCEDCNDLMEALVQDMDAFVQDAISADGRGHFLSSYDSEEVEVVIDGVYYFAYRQN
jgi:hypothetical protein